MANSSSDLRLLSQLPVGSVASVKQVSGGRQTIRQLQGLGLRPGEQFKVLHRRGRSVVVISQGNRIAIGESVAAQVLTEPVVALSC